MTNTDTRCSLGWINFLFLVLHCSRLHIFKIMKTMLKLKWKLHQLMSETNTI